MPGMARTITTSGPRRIGALCGALTSMLGLIVLVGWMVRSTLLIQVEPQFPPMKLSSALNFALSGLAILGIAAGWRRVVLICSGTVATLAGLSVSAYFLQAGVGLDQLLGIVSAKTSFLELDQLAPTPAICFLIVAVALLLAESAFHQRGPVLGIAGLVVAAAGTACWISVLSG